MKLLAANEPSIVPAVADTPSGKYAYLHWVQNIDSEIIACLQRKELLFNYTFCGFEHTVAGDLAWVLALIDTVDNTNSSTANLFWFDFVINPGDIEPTTCEFIDLLHTQSKLEIAIPYNNKSVHLHTLMKGEQLKQYVIALERCREHWKHECDYRKAVAHLQDKVFPKLQKEAMASLAHNFEYESDPIRRLCFQFKQEIIAQLPIDNQLRSLCLESELDDVVNYLLNWSGNLNLSEKQLLEFLASRDTDAAENIQRNWLFAKLCYELSPKGLQVCIGVDATERWLWADLPFTSKPSVELLYTISRNYRYLLTHNWKNLLNSNEALLGSINLAHISCLGQVPNRKAFESLTKILQAAAVDRSFGISQRTAVLINKRGLEEIEFYPLGNAGLQCLFKIKVAYHKPQDYVILGKIDAPAGKIEAVGIEESKEIKLLLFLVAITYRDLLVARKVVCPPERQNSRAHNKTRAKDRHQPIKLIPRIKYQKSSQIDESFASPDQLVKGLKRFHTYLRGCHLRKLHEGWQASFKQIQIAEQYQFLVPEGYTFVSPALVVGEGNLRERDEFRSISLLEILFNIEE